MLPSAFHFSVRSMQPTYTSFTSSFHQHHNYWAHQKSRSTSHPSRSSRRQDAIGGMFLHSLQREYTCGMIMSWLGLITKDSSNTSSIFPLVHTVSNKFIYYSWLKCCCARTSFSVQSKIITDISPVMIIWLNYWLVHNLSDYLTACISCPDWQWWSTVAMFPDVSNYFSEYNVVISNRNYC